MRRAHHLIVGLAAVTLAGGLAACGGDDDGSSSATTAAVAPATTAHDDSMMSMPPRSDATATTAPDDGGDAVAPMSVTVDISDFAFVAPDVRVAVGGTVTWSNRDDQQHTATGAGAFDTGVIKPGESKTVTFDEAGSFAYACSFHPFMTGTVSVG